MNNFILDVGSETVPFPHYWELCVGSCHAALALREDYRQHLTKCSKELGFKYIRFHGLFTDDMSVLHYGRGGALSGSKPILSFMNIDSVFDYLLSIGMKPFVELGFMPKALTGGTSEIFHYRALTSPPDDYGKWQWLVEQFAQHCVERYGLDEVRQWFFEVWNEPNLGIPDKYLFWGGTQEDYFKLYEVSARGLKNVDHRLKVGGPATSHNAWIPEFIEYCRKNDVPLDFISTHHYPTDDAGGTTLNDILSATQKLQKGEVGHEAVAEAMAKMAHSKATQWQRVERGILTKKAKKAKEEADGLPLYYTEWSVQTGPNSDGPFGASFVSKTIMDNAGLVDGYSYWTFSDIFEEHGMPHKEFHGNYGLMTLHGIPKALYGAFRLLNKLGTERYIRQYASKTVDIYAVRKKEIGVIQILAVNHESFEKEISDEEITIQITGLSSYVGATIERVDEDNGNPLKGFIEMGSPDYIRESEWHELMGASSIKTTTLEAKFCEGTAELSFVLPKQGVALITIYE